MVYGPGDHRFRPWLDKMFAHLPEIRLGELASRWQGCWGYVENVAHAIAWLRPTKALPLPEAIA